MKQLNLIFGLLLLSGLVNAELQVTNIAAYQAVAYSGQPYQFTATVTNPGTETQTRYVEGCIYPQSWRGLAYPYTYYTSVPVTGCCPANEYCEAKQITLAPGQSENVLFQPKAPSQTSTDACNALGSAWGSGSPNFDIVVGTASCCKCGYLSYKVNSGLNIQTMTTTIPQTTTTLAGCRSGDITYPNDHVICYNGFNNKCMNGMWTNLNTPCGSTTTTTIITTTIPVCPSGYQWNGYQCVQQQQDYLLYIIGFIVVVIIILIIIVTRKKR